jgi:DNA-binding CsgD family transcriptional regulator
MLRAVQAWDRALSGGTAAECAALAADVLGLDDRVSAQARVPIFTAMVAGSVLILADDRRAQAFWDQWYLEAVRDGRAHAVIGAGAWHGFMDYRLGRLADAEAAIRAAMAGPRDWGPGTERVPASTVALLAHLLLERGDLRGAQAALDRVPERLEPDSEGALLHRCAELRLLVARSRSQEALDMIDPVVARLRTVRNPAWAPWRTDRAEALAQVGRKEEAIAVGSEELELARHWGTPGPIGRALTLLGRLEGRVELLEEAVESTRDPFARLEHAEALFALGRAVRQRRRPREARGHLRAAHDLASRCGAAAIAARASEELAAAGGRAKAAIGSGAAALTPSERRVAELAAAGRTNRDIAGQLYLSLKTVEVHLSNSYRKLGIRSRSELGSALEPAAVDA